MGKFSKDVLKYEKCDLLRDVGFSLQSYLYDHQRFTLCRLEALQCNNGL